MTRGEGEQPQIDIIFLDRFVLFLDNLTSQKSDSFKSADFVLNGVV